MKKSTKILVTIIIFLTVFISSTAMIGIIVQPKCKVKIEEKVETNKNNTKKEFKQNENILFLGDSITEIYPIDEIYKNMPVIKSGVSGYKTEDILERAEKMIYQYNPTKIILLIGTNDIMNSIEDDTIMETVSGIKKISKEINSHRKNAKIYIESIYPVNRNMKKEMVAARTNEAIKKLNEKIKIYCEENNITYINMYDELTDEEGNFDEKYTYDGLHPNTLGYAKITRVLIPYIYEDYDMK